MAGTTGLEPATSDVTGRGPNLGWGPCPFRFSWWSASRGGRFRLATVRATVRVEAGQHHVLNSKGIADRQDRIYSMLTEIQSTWLKHLVSTEPCDRPRAEAALRAWYPEILKRPAPECFFWFDSPERAGWSVKLLESAKERMWQAFVEQKSSTREGRLLIESLRTDLCARAGLRWDQLTQIAGRHRTQQTMFSLQRLALHGVDQLLAAARPDHPQHSEYKSRVRPLFDGLNKDSEMYRIENPFYDAILAACG
jgi:hypothetical protein